MRLVGTSAMRAMARPALNQAQRPLNWVGRQLVKNPEETAYLHTKQSIVGKFLAYLGIASPFK